MTRRLLLYLRSRRVPAAFATAVVAAAGLWWVGELTDHAEVGRLLAVVAGTVAAGPGLAGPDVELDRTAAIGWPPRRAAHLVAIAVVCVVAAATPAGAPAVIARDAAGMVGLLGLGAVLLGASRSWLPPLIWTLVALTALPRIWPVAPDGAFQVLTWMLQPVESAAAGWTAAVLAIAGLLSYAAAGPRSG
ncbi:MAG TPA: hypothetical protein VIL37_21300 [Natronosporangium sp.]